MYEGGDSGVVFHAGLRAEASADFEFGLGRPERILAVVVRGRNGRVSEEGEDRGLCSCQRLGRSRPHSGRPRASCPCRLC